MGQRGFSLVELLVVMVIMGILLTIATLNWNNMQTKSAIESQIKTMHADLLEVRLQALYTKTPRSVVISGQQYKEYATADTSVAPLVTKQLRYPVVWNGGGTTLTFDAQGLTNNERSICILPTNDTTVVNSASVDSIVVSTARINLGWRNGGDCTSANIDQK
jgi:prepilin-type N-terminal cleavage/methylation domain-containing protein